MKSWQPAIANIVKKNRSTSIESLSRGMALIREDTMMRRPWMLEIVLRGRITLNDLNTDKLPPLPCRNILRKPDTMIVKSRMFHGSLKYDPLFRIKPFDTTLQTISVVYKY